MQTVPRIDCFYFFAILLSGAAEASEVWVFKLVKFIQTLQEMNAIYQRKKLKSGCVAAHPAHPVPPSLAISLSCQSNVETNDLLLERNYIKLFY